MKTTEKPTCTHEVHTATMTWRCIKQPGHEPADLHYLIRVQQPPAPRVTLRLRLKMLVHALITGHRIHRPKPRLVACLDCLKRWPL